MLATSTSEKLQRIALRTSDGLMYQFSINPQSIQEAFPARNVFLQGEQGVQMQGFGPGLHTITISGTTGVNPYRGAALTNQEGGHRAGFERYSQLYEKLKGQLESAHDNASAMASSDMVGGLTLDYLDYTNEHYYTVELSPEGFSFSQSVDNPLSYTYTMNFTVLKEASAPTYAETSWVVLGNVDTTLSKDKLPEQQSMIKLESKYQGALYADMYKTKYASAVAKAKEMAKDMAKRGVDGARSTIINYTDATSGSLAYTFKKPLSRATVKNIYKSVYTGIHKVVHLSVNGANFADVELSSDDPQAWDAYWSLYTDTAYKIEHGNQNGIINYGQTDAGDAAKDTPEYDLQRIFKKLYGSTVPVLDLTQYADADAIYQKLFGEVLSKFDGDSYSEAASVFSEGIKGTILNYGQIDANDIAVIVKPSDLQATYQALYGTTVSNFDAQKYRAASAMFAQLKSGTINNYTGEESYDEEPSDRYQNISAIYNELYGQTLTEDDYDYYEDYFSNTDETTYEDADSIDYGQLADEYRASLTDSVTNWSTDYLKGADVDEYVNRATPTVSDTISWASVTQSNAYGTGDFYQTPSSTTSTSQPSVGSSTYTNPYVSTDAPLYAYNEINNLLKL